MNSKIKLAGLGLIAAVAASSPFVLKVVKQDAVASPEVAQTAPATADSQPVQTPASAGANFTEAQKVELESIIKEYILNNPKVLMDSVNNMRANEQKAQEDGAAQALKDNSDYLLKGNLPDVGNKNADVTIVEFFDYNCGYCKQGYEAVQQGLDTDKNLRFVFVDFPILSESSHLASRYALAAQKQGKYFELHRELMKYKGPKTDESILGLAKTAGLDIDKLKADLNSPDIEAAIKKNTELAQKLAISGTPAFIIGDEIIRGYIPFDGMKAKIEEKRKKG